MWHAWEKEKCTRFWWESLKERDHFEDQDVDGKTGSEWMLGRLAGGKWIQLAQDRGRCWVVVNAVMHLQVLVPRSQSVKAVVN
jgi:hypothetical protein